MRRKIGLGGGRLVIKQERDIRKGIKDIQKGRNLSAILVISSESSNSLGL
jgi:hypothetical protein